MKKYFELNKPFKLEATDITALIYTICTILGIMGYNVTILFTIGAIIGTAFCWQARRINVIILNVALLVFNLFNFINLF